MNVLITGSTIHSRQYMESFMFDKNIKLSFWPDLKNNIFDAALQYGINIVDNELLRLNVDYYDVIIVANKLKNKKNVLRFFSELNYKGKYIIEKPFAYDNANHQVKLEFLENNDYIVAYSRQLYKQAIKDKISIIEMSELYWPNFYALGIDIIRDTLPHVLDFLVIVNDDMNFEILDTYSDKDKLILFVCIKNKQIKVVIYNTAEDDLVRFDNVIFEWPNYFRFNQEFMKCLYENDYVIENNKANEIISILYYKIVGGLKDE